MNSTRNETAPVELAAHVGIDWADREHAVCVRTADGAMECRMLAQQPAAVAEWAQELRARFGGRPVGVCLEQSRGALVYALSAFSWIVLYPINPKSLARYRESLYPSRSKNDPTDAALLSDFLAKHRDQLRPWKAEDSETLQLRLLLENRETLVDDRTRLSHRLRDTLKRYFPQAIEWAGPLTHATSWAFLLKWPRLTDLKRTSKGALLRFFHAHHVRRVDKVAEIWPRIQAAVDPVSEPALVESSVLMVQSLCRQLQTLQPAIDEHDRQIEALYARHPDKALFDNLPGAGPVLGPRLLVAFGTDRDKYTAPEQLQQLGGIAPVTEQSGQRSWTHWRWAASSFLRQSFHEFAAHSILRSAWARAYYQLQRQRGKKHHAAVRALAYKWIRVLYRCWKDRQPYDEARYVACLIAHGSPLAAALQPPAQVACE